MLARGHWELLHAFSSFLLLCMCEHDTTHPVPQKHHRGEPVVNLVAGRVAGGGWVDVHVDAVHVQQIRLGLQPPVKKARQQG